MPVKSQNINILPRRDKDRELLSQTARDADANELQSDDIHLMEIFQQHYAELRRERSEYEDTPCTSSNAKSLACEVGSTSSKYSTSDSPRNAISS